MATVTRPPTDLMTAEEFYEFVHRPENEDRFFELDEGRVVEWPLSTVAHGFVCGLMGYLLGNYSKSSGFGQVATNNVGTILGRNPDTVLAPDVVCFGERKSREALAREDGYTEEIPLLAVEVLSPSDRPSRVARKVNQYLRAGVKLVWIVDPEIREVGVHRPDVELELLGMDDLLKGGNELPGFECRIAEFFELPGEAAATE